MIDIKRDDLIHPFISGNKWRKLVGHVHQLRERSATTFVSFGGPYSNHLLALAKLGQMMRLNTVGVIRSPGAVADSLFMQQMRVMGMNIIVAEEKAYVEQQHWDAASWAQYLDAGGIYLLPMGGTDKHAIEGFVQMAPELLALGQYDYVYTSIGSGGTLAGWSHIVSEHTEVIAIAPFKGRWTHWPGKALVNTRAHTHVCNCMLNVRFGGQHIEINKIMKDFHQECGVYLDPIYTARTLYNLKEDILHGRIVPGSRVLFYHSGGLLGALGYAHRYKIADIPILPLTVEIAG